MVPDETTLPSVSQNELQAMAYTDQLTGLGNRYRLRDKVRMLAAERANDPAPFTVALVNLDGFKPINDLFRLGGRRRDSLPGGPSDEGLHPRRSNSHAP